MNGIQVTVREACVSDVAGVLHIVSDVIAIPPLVTLHRLLETDPRVSIFTSVLRQSGLLDLLFLVVPNIHTVFAPTNEAFNSSQYSPDLLNCIISTGGNTLNRLLRYHIVGPAEYQSSLSLNRYWVLTTSSDYLRVSVNENGTVVLSNDLSVRIIDGDVRARNGVMHVIDRVLPLQGLALGECERFATTAPPPLPTTPTPGSGSGASPLLLGT